DRLRDRLPTIQQTVVLGGEKDEYEHWVGQAEPLRELPETTLDDCFLQLYTSGTTGWPKGAMLTQRSMTTHTNAVAPAYEMDQDTVNIVAMPLFHVGGTSWALGSMATGGRTIVVRELAELLPEVAKHQATPAFVVPAVLHALLQHPKADELGVGQHGDRRADHRGARDDRASAGSRQTPGHARVRGARGAPRAAAAPEDARAAQPAAGARLRRLPHACRVDERRPGEAVDAALLGVRHDRDVGRDLLSAPGGTPRRDPSPPPGVRGAHARRQRTPRGRPDDRAGRARRRARRVLGAVRPADGGLLAEAGGHA